MAHVNIEIKARCADPDRVRDALKGAGAAAHGTDRQTDTYLNVPRGRLKLREGNIENALVFYERDDEAGPKQSDVTLCRVSPQSEIKATLLAALGTLVVVEKWREIYFIDNVKFHIDVVPALGSFVEIEAIDIDGSFDRDALRKQCDYYVSLFEIRPEDFVSQSYSDLLLASRQA